MRLSDFKALTFDCYGTLINWETGLSNALQPLLGKRGGEVDRDTVLADFGRHEAAQQAATPGLIYSDLLSQVHRRLATEWGVVASEQEHVQFGQSVGGWPAFPDTVEALRYLQRHYKLIVLSNVDRRSFQGTQVRLGIEFDAVYTAQDIGSYKPDPRNFKYLIERVAELGISKTQILHTAQSLFHDHVPANAAGLASAWIDRRHQQPGWGASVPPATPPHYDFRFPSLAAMARAHEEES